MTLEQIRSEFLQGDLDMPQVIDALQNDCDLTSEEAEELLLSWIDDVPPPSKFIEDGEGLIVVKKG